MKSGATPANLTLLATKKNQSSDVFTMKGVQRMTRKQRKQLRKNKPQPFKPDKELNDIMWQMARIMTKMPRDKSKDGMVFYDGETGCYDYVGGKMYCGKCPYNFNRQGCHKIREA